MPQDMSSHKHIKSRKEASSPCSPFLPCLSLYIDLRLWIFGYMDMWVDGCMDIWIYGCTRVYKQRTAVLLPLVRPHYEFTRKLDREMDRNVIFFTMLIELSALIIITRCSCCYSLEVWIRIHLFDSFLHFDP